MLSIAKLQNLKAIHNDTLTYRTWRRVIINRKTTKFESNSQPYRTCYLAIGCCYQSQNYKIWKQFTTIIYANAPHDKLLSIAKLQNLKAIHNPFISYQLLFKVVINRKTTKFESNSQQVDNSNKKSPCCYQSQNYKIWKQFTTGKSNRGGENRLLSIAKLQNLKAIHNGFLLHPFLISVVINRKTTKFESNSQLNLYSLGLANGCYQSQNYKIWKQFTTGWGSHCNFLLLLSIAKLQNLKAIHNATSLQV